MSFQASFRDLELLVDRPFEHLLIEALCGGQIATTDFEMNNRMRGALAAAFDVVAPARPAIAAILTKFRRFESMTSP